MLKRTRQVGSLFIGHNTRFQMRLVNTIPDETGKHKGNVMSVGKERLREVLKSGLQGTEPGTLSAKYTVSRNDPPVDW